MDYSELLVSLKEDEQQLLSFGFIHKDNNFLLKRQSQNKDFSFLITYKPTLLTLDLIDNNTQELYPPFSLPAGHSDFIEKLRDEGEELIKLIVSSCFKSTSIRDKVVTYIKEKYQADPIYPWKDYPTYCTFKSGEKEKWFGLLMKVPYPRLGVNLKGEADVLNLKVAPEEILSLIDKKIYFPAYHMDKKHWLSIVLTTEAPFKDVCHLIDESYLFSQQKKGK
ncbi:MAG: MmcQ/YjbR family DNA-binding protein [Bacilli bacterium]|jgi:predicted DNA-binding protein (MmcQ/YjbR family)|nr:MmcQ/YjbR family DNA-binding protein [Bacilli bacterium]